MLKRRLRGIGKRLLANRDAVDPIIAAVEPFTMTSPERLEALVSAVRYVSRYEIGGAIVECGVWRGGSMMAAAMTLLESGVTDRELFLYDTFEGMVEPGAEDRDLDGIPAAERLREADRGDEASVWCVASLEEVRANLHSTGYPSERVHFVEGRVEETIPEIAPERIAILRLDTDWYESTRHELEHLLPLLRPGGVLILDDYGHWEGARRAVDEHLDETGLPLLLNPIDYTGRIAVMPGIDVTGRAG